MRESSYKAYPFLAAIRPDRAGKQAVRIRENGGEQGNPVVFEHGLQPVSYTHLVFSLYLRHTPSYNPDGGGHFVRPRFYEKGPIL